MHFGLPPRFNKDVRIIQLDIAPETIGQNAPTEVALVGDGKAIVGQLNQALEKREWVYPKDIALACRDRREGGGECGADRAPARRTTRRRPTTTAR